VSDIPGPPWTGELSDLMEGLGHGHVVAEDVLLGAVLHRYRAHLQELAPIDLDEAGTFAATAARLMLLKSSRILAQPTDGEAEESGTEEPAWLDHAALARVAAGLRTAEAHESMPPAATAPVIERRAAPRPVALLQRAWRDMGSRQADEAVPVHVPTFVRLESAVSSLIRRLKHSVRLRFRQLIDGGGRTEVVMQFLAVLELVRRRNAQVEQEQLFGDMIIELQEGASERAARAG